MENEGKLIALLDKAISDPVGPSIAWPLSQLDAGIRSFARTPLPARAAWLVDEEADKRIKPWSGGRYFLTCLRNDGYSPSYNQYIVVRPLTKYLDQADSQDVARQAVRTLADSLRDMLGWRLTAELSDSRPVKESPVETGPYFIRCAECQEVIFAAGALVFSVCAPIGIFFGNKIMSAVLSTGVSIRRRSI
jgi:hypothetical protein